MMHPFCGHFYGINHQQLNSNKFKDFKAFEYYGIQIETFKLTAVEWISKDEKTRLWNQNCMMKNTSRGPKNLFDLNDFSN